LEPFAYYDRSTWRESEGDRYARTWRNAQTVQGTPQRLAIRLDPAPFAVISSSRKLAGIVLLRWHGLT